MRIRLISFVTLAVICQGQIASCKFPGKADPQKVKLYVPPLEEVRQVLANFLPSQFAVSSVEVVNCPNLKNAPFYLAASGLGGNPKLADVGGIANLMPIVKTDKKYDMAVVAKTCGSPHAFIMGPGAGPFYDLGHNCELISHVDFGVTPPKIGTHLAWIGDNDSYVSGPWTNSTGFALMGNFLLTDGKPGTPVIHIVVKNRTTDENFITSIRKQLSSTYGNKSVGIGGVFVIKTGKVKLHVMPEFSAKPLNTTEDLEKWLRYFDMDAPLICPTVFYSHDPGLDLRIEHSHCFSRHGQGGHYHYDVSPEEMEYEAYLTLAEQVYRIDKP